MLTSGAQSIAGVKTFTSIPVLPASDPTTDNQAARKAYVDAQHIDMPIDSIAHGLEIAWDSTTTVVVNSGVVYHGVVRINKTVNTTLTLATGADWYDGSPHSYAGGAGWCYIGMDSSGNIKLLHTNAPDKADTDGLTAGTKLYWLYAANNIYYRVLGAVYVNTSDIITTYYSLRNEAYKAKTTGNNTGSVAAAESETVVATITIATKIGQKVIIIGNGAMLCTNTNMDGTFYLYRDAVQLAITPTLLKLSNAEAVAGYPPFGFATLAYVDTEAGEASTVYTLKGKVAFGASGAGTMYGSLSILQIP